MTVKHLQQIQRRQLILAVSMDRSVLEKFRNGFSECASEIKSFISQMPELEPALRQRLSNHLESSVTKIQNTTPVNLASTFEGKTGNQWSQGSFNSLQMTNEPLSTPFLDDLNNNQRLQMDLVPTRLPSGELAFVMPNSTHLNMPSNASGMRFMSNTSTPRLSAFNLVSNKSHSLTKLHHTSPPLSPISTSDDRQLRTPPSSTLSLFHSAFSKSLSSGNPFTNLSNSRLDSGYKSDTSMSDLICKPAVPQQSYLELLKPKLTHQVVALGPHSSESTLNLSCRDSPCSSGSSNLREMDHDKESMWRPW